MRESFYHGSKRKLSCVTITKKKKKKKKRVCWTLKITFIVGMIPGHNFKSQLEYQRKWSRGNLNLRP